MLAAGFTLIGPYSLLAQVHEQLHHSLISAGVSYLTVRLHCSGVFAGDLGGPGAAATACGLIDFAGYCGSIVLMLVGDRAPFSGVAGQQPYLLIFVVFGLLAAAVAVGLSGVLIRVKRRSRSMSETRIV